MGEEDEGGPLTFLLMTPPLPLNPSSPAAAGDGGHLSTANGQYNQFHVTVPMRDGIL